MKGWKELILYFFRMTIKSKKCKLIFVALFILIVTPSLVNLGTYFIPIQSVGSGSIWIGFWGSYLGGTLTLVAMVYTINEQKRIARDTTRNELAIADLKRHGEMSGLYRDIKYSMGDFDDYYTDNTEDAERTREIDKNWNKLIEEITKARKRYHSIRFKTVFVELEDYYRDVRIKMHEITKSNSDSKRDEAYKLWNNARRSYFNERYLPNEVEIIARELQE